MIRNITSDDQLLLANLIDNLPGIAINEAKQISHFYPSSRNKIANLEFDYPFDKSIEDEMKKLLPIGSSDALYRKVESLKSLWQHLLGKSIKCLRFFDNREPYLKIPGKHPQSYGLEGLIRYYEEFAQFEALLYGSNQFYRDHVIHLFRTWLIGMNVLLSESDDNQMHRRFHFEGISGDSFTFNFFECISVWTMASLCHDLGYPLERFREVIDKTQRMMEYVVARPNIHQDITFSGTQDKLNENIIKLISSKMKPSVREGQFSARTQSKYFMKYSKSLEDYKHGVISAIIIYKALLYFLESDFSIHDDYLFDAEEAKQFYLRRDILRSIASHTCWDIYHMHCTTFPFLLILADELQQWGRKSWTDIYKGQKLPSTRFSLVKYDPTHVVVEYQFGKVKSVQIAKLLGSLYDQFKKYRMLFRDGLDTENRSFSFYVIYRVELETGKTIVAETMIPSNTTAYFKIASKDYKRKGDFVKILGRETYLDKLCAKEGDELSFILA